MKWKDRNLQEVAKIVCGDAGYFPYRSSSYITEFFQDCDLDYTHDGSTRWKWVVSRLEEILTGLAKHLTDKDIERITNILDGWNDKLTWEALCDACLTVISSKPARQTLVKFTRIENAFKACKKRLKKEDVPELRAPPTIRVATERIARLERENECIKRENAELLEQFVVWQYNSHIRGLNDYGLNRALPGIDRGRTG